MRVSEDERSELHNADETREVQDLGIRVSTIEDTGKVEELSTLIYLRPETLFEGLFSVLERSSFFNEVEMSEDSNDFGETVGLEDIEEFKRFLEKNSARYN